MVRLSVITQLEINIYVVNIGGGVAVMLSMTSVS